jgi:hypothetical protein
MPDQPGDREHSPHAIRPSLTRQVIPHHKMYGLLRLNGEHKAPQ